MSLLMSTVAGHHCVPSAPWRGCVDRYVVAKTCRGTCRARNKTRTWIYRHVTWSMSGTGTEHPKVNGILNMENHSRSGMKGAKGSPSHGDLIPNVMMIGIWLLVPTTRKVASSVVNHFGSRQPQLHDISFQDADFWVQILQIPIGPARRPLQQVLL